MKNTSKKRRDFILQLGKALGIVGATSITSNCFAKSAVSKNAIIKSIALKKSANGQLRLVFALDKKIKHKLITLRSPDRIVIDFLDTGIENKPLSLGKNKVSGVKLIKKIRQSARNDSDYRIVLDLSKKAKAITKCKTTSSGQH